MMDISPKLIAGVGSFVVAAGVSAVMLGTAGFAAGHSTAAPVASHQHVAVGASGATAVGLTLLVKPAPVRIAVQPLKVTLTSTTKPRKVAKPAKSTKSGTDPGSCPGMGGSGGYGPGGGGKPGGH